MKSGAGLEAGTKGDMRTSRGVGGRDLGASGGRDPKRGREACAGH